MYEFFSHPRYLKYCYGQYVFINKRDLKGHFSFGVEVPSHSIAPLNLLVS